MPAAHSVPRTDQDVVLIVEDESNLRHLVELVLVRSGYRVIAASDGITALRLFAEHGENLSVVLTDLEIPGLHGLELIQAIRMRSQSIPVIIASGTFAEWSPEKFEGLAIAAFVEKPFTTSQLLKTISDVKRRPSASEPPP